MAVNAVPLQTHVKTAPDSSGQKTGGKGGFSSIMNSVLPDFTNALNNGRHLQAMTDKAVARSAAASLGAEIAAERKNAAASSAAPQRTKENGVVSGQSDRQQNRENAVEKPAKNDETASTKETRPKPEAEQEAEIGRAQPPLNEKENPEQIPFGAAETVAGDVALVAVVTGEAEKAAAPVRDRTAQNAAPSNAKPVEAPVPPNMAPVDEAPELAEAAKAAIEQAKIATPNAAADQTSRSVAQKTDAISQQSAGLARAAGNQPVAISVETKAEATRAPGSAILAQSASDLSPGATVTAAASQTATQDSGRHSNGSTGEQPAQGQSAADAARLASQQAASAASATATVANRAAAVASDAQPAFSETLRSAATPGIAAAMPIDAAAGLTSARSPEVAQAAAINARTAILPHTMEQIKVQIGKGLADGQDTIKMQLHPSELGRIEIRLEMRSGQVTATIIADRQETLQLLKNDSQALQQSLQDAGLDSNKNSLSFQLRSDNEQAEQRSAEKGAEEETRGVDVAEDVIQPKIAETVGDGVVNITV